MACAVYCLLRHPEQLDPLVERLWDAGVCSEDIAVVVRRGSDQLFFPQFPETARVAEAFWDLSVNSAAALWWPLALCGWAAWGRVAGKHALIPLDLYRARRKSG